MVIAVTGATGFLGSALLERLSTQYGVVALVRKEPLVRLAGVDYRICGDLSPSQEWSHLLPGVDVVIHTAARVHVMDASSSAAVNEFRRTNVEGTINLAQQAANGGAKRFIFLSSIKVNGEFTDPDRPFSAEDGPNPQEAYSISKMEAEQGLQEIGAKCGMEIVCIRPPLVYGPGVKGNFLSMLRWLKLGVPLPLGSIHNKRSLVSLENLVDLIITCIDYPAAANQIFLVSDDEDLSTSELLQRMSAALGQSVRLIPVPAKLLQMGAQMLGKKDVAQRLFGNLQVDISKTKNLLGWSPPMSVNEGLRKTAKWYLRQ